MNCAVITTIPEGKQPATPKLYRECLKRWGKQYCDDNLILVPVKIEHAAIRNNGRIWTGPNHAAIVTQIMIDTECECDGGEDGFITNEGEFVDRCKAAKIAYAAKQIDEELTCLYSYQLKMEA